MEGHLKILSPQALDRGDEKAPTVTAENYADHPLIILSRDKKKKSRGLLRTRTEIIGLCCRQAIIFWTCADADLDTSAPSHKYLRGF